MCYVLCCSVQASGTAFESLPLAGHRVWCNRQAHLQIDTNDIVCRHVTALNKWPRCFDSYLLTFTGNMGCRMARGSAWVSFVPRPSTPPDKRGDNGVILVANIVEECIGVKPVYSADYFKPSRGCFI